MPLADRRLCLWLPAHRASFFHPWFTSCRAAALSLSLRLLPWWLQGNWADMQGKDIYIRNYYSTKALFDVMPGGCGTGGAGSGVGRWQMGRR